MARKFEDEATVIRIFTPNQDKMLEALKYVLHMKDTNEARKPKDISAVKAALTKAKHNTYYSSSFPYDDGRG